MIGGVSRIRELTEVVTNLELQTGHFYRTVEVIGGFPSVEIIDQYAIR